MPSIARIEGKGDLRVINRLAEVENKVREFILGELRWNGRGDELVPDYPLFGSAIADSIAFFQLIALVEQEYDVNLLDDGFEVDEFSSISMIANKVTVKLNASASRRR